MKWLSDVGPIVPILLLVAAGIGYLIRRRISGQAEVEDQESLERTLRLKKLLEAEQMSVEEVVELRETFRRGKGGLLGAEARALVEKGIEAEKAALDGNPDKRTEPSVAFEDTTLGMVATTGAELKAIDAQLEVAVLALSSQHSEARASQLRKSQAAWERFCQADADYASLVFEGGSLARVARVTRLVELSEERLRELALYQAESDL